MNINFGFSCKNIIRTLIHSNKTRLFDSLNNKFIFNKVFISTWFHSIYSKFHLLSLNSLMLMKMNESIINQPIVKITTMRRKKLKMKKHKSTKRREALKKRQTSKLK